MNKKNVVVVDVRRENEVERGEIDFPRRAASRVLQVPREQLRGNFKNSSAVDANLTALKVANLKGVKRGTKVRLLPIRPRSRGARRSLRTFPVVTLHPRFPFNV